MQLQTQQTQLQGELAKLSETSYLETLARQQLSYVRPGEELYIVTNPPGETADGTDSSVAAGASQTPGAPQTVGVRAADYSNDRRSGHRGRGGTRRYTHKRHGRAERHRFDRRGVERHFEPRGQPAPDSRPAFSRRSSLPSAVCSSADAREIRQSQPVAEDRPARRRVGRSGRPKLEHRPEGPSPTGRPPRVPKGRRLRGRPVLRSRPGDPVRPVSERRIYQATAETGGRAGGGKARLQAAGPNARGEGRGHSP